MSLRGWWMNRQRVPWPSPRRCVHHNPKTAASYLVPELADGGKDKIWTCKRCLKVWRFPEWGLEGTPVGRSSEDTS